MASPQLDRALNIALSWPAPAGIDALAGASLVRDGPPASYPELAITRAILRYESAYRAVCGAASLHSATNAPLAGTACPRFLAATLLQESAYDVKALSPAGAVGIAQFMPETAVRNGIDPYDPFAAIGGAAVCIGGYVRRVSARAIADPYALALAAYNAGPAPSRVMGASRRTLKRKRMSTIFTSAGRVSRLTKCSPADFHKGRLKRRP